MRRSLLLLISTLIFISSASTSIAQGRRFDPDEMIKREKQNVYSAIKDLSDDQKMLLDGIYEEFSVSFKELREEVMQTRNFREMRPKMEALRDEKDGLINDVLNEDQYLIYQGIVEKRRNQMRENMQRRRESPDSRTLPADPPADSPN